ncbi:hypothetical protein ANCDUO_13285 [Ancylostoma duodenale]|uniref:Uncharacterized protein n=1 Tax=Ancylostoma duodenale TaxID=51022 RepID=A0A0C2CJC1_9BILA|nr:hypothetical protein ANCDUO_13285 [Ancylostoma duodenale]
MEIALQDQSKGILYEGYTKAFRQCIFEEGDVVGKNERYEFRLDELAPEEKQTPPTRNSWLMIIFIILAAVLLLAILGTLLWLLAKRRKQKPKKAGFLNDASASSKGGYTALHSQRRGGGGRDSDDRGILVHEQETYSTPDHLYGGYGSRSYSHSDSHRGFAPPRRDGGYGNGMYGGDGRNRCQARLDVDQ